MKPVLSRSQSREFDAKAIRQGVPSVVLMENAGRGAAEVMREQYPRATRFLVVCGPGNNGGDGLVVARRLLTYGLSVEVWLACAPAQLRDDAALQWAAYCGVGGRYSIRSSQSSSGDDNARVICGLEDADVVVDAMFGTGLTRCVDGTYAQLVEALNGSGKPVVALDLPSGLDADSGTKLGVCVRAAHTIAFAFAKPGLFSTFAQSVVGQLHVVDIGVPPVVPDTLQPVFLQVEEQDVRAALRTRTAVSHKGQAGHVLVVAGASGTMGAARLSAHGAMRSGAGLVTLAARAEVASALESTAWEVMVRALPSQQALAVDALAHLLPRSDSIVFGPGLGVDAISSAWASYILREYAGTLVLDADGLTLFAGNVNQLADSRANLILTPHPGEAARLLACSTDEVEADRFGAARELARLSRSTVVLKGGPSLVAAGGEVWVCARGHQCLSTAGAGDVLCGIIAALGVQLPAASAAWVGSTLHAYAGVRWAESQGTSGRGLLAREIADQVPAVIGALLA